VADSGALALFSNIGISELLTDLPNVCYPDLVREFYGNLHVDIKGKFVSFVSGVKMNLSPVIFGEILGVKLVNAVSIYKKRGSVSLDGFSAIEQLRIVVGVSDLEDFVNPSTALVVPMAHLLFRICIANICPRMGTKSNFSCQDITVVAMLMSGRGFDVCDLILHNMLEVTTGSISAGLPYGLLLTKVFEFYGLELENEVKLLAKDGLDARMFGQSGLALSKDGVLVQVEIQSAMQAVKDASTSKSSRFVTVNDMDAYLDEVRAVGKEVRDCVAKVNADSAEFHKKLDMVVEALKLQQVTPDQLDAIVKAATQILQETSPQTAADPTAPASGMDEDEEAVEA
jgi:hypothetical protein